MGCIGRRTVQNARLALSVEFPDSSLMRVSIRHVVGSSASQRLEHFDDVVPV